MNHTLDKIYGIPYYTNNIDQLFSWYSIYNDGVIVTEINNYSSVDFNNIPKIDMKYFGLFGCGFHLSCNMNTGEINIYQSYKDNELLYSIAPTIEENKLLILNSKKSFNIHNLTPFTFKQFVLETNFDNKLNSKSFIDKYYAGYSGLIDLDKNIQILFKIYFSIYINDFPNSIGIIYKFFPYKKTEYQNKFYRFELAENVYCNIEDIHKVSNNNIYKILNFYENNGYYKNKIIFSYR